jgi:hypothetical protein
VRAVHLAELFDDLALHRSPVRSPSLELVEDCSSDLGLLNSGWS